MLERNICDVGSSQVVGFRLKERRLKLKGSMAITQFLKQNKLPNHPFIHNLNLI